MNLQEFTGIYRNLQEFSDQNAIRNIFDNQNIVYNHQKFDFLCFCGDRSRIRLSAENRMALT